MAILTTPAAEKDTRNVLTWRTTSSKQFVLLQTACQHVSWTDWKTAKLED